MSRTGLGTHEGYMGVGCIESIALGLLLLGVGTICLGTKGFSQAGLPFGLGLQIRGAAGKTLGLLLILLGCAMTVPFVWLVFRSWLTG
jgi:hypothetical protein